MLGRLPRVSGRISAVGDLLAALVLAQLARGSSGKAGSDAATEAAAASVQGMLRATTAEEVRAARGAGGAAAVAGRELRLVSSQEALKALVVVHRVQPLV